MQKVRHSQNRVFVTLSHVLVRPPPPHVTHPKVTNFEMNYIKNIALGCLMYTEQRTMTDVKYIQYSTN